MKRSPMVRKPKKRKVKAIKALRATKPQTRSRVSKGPARSPEHLALVRQEKCLLHRDMWAPCYGAVQAHHCRHLKGRTLGKRVSDFFVTPLCVRHHILLHEGGNEDRFWQGYLVEPRDFIRAFLRRTYPEPRPEGVAEALAMIEKQRTMDGRTVLR